MLVSVGCFQSSLIRQGVWSRQQRLAMLGWCWLRQSLRRQACNARNALRTPQAPLRRKLCSAAAEGAAKEEGLLAKGQVDSGFFQGTALFAGVMFGAQASSDEQRATALDGLVGWYRSMGVSSKITDRQALPPQLTYPVPREAR